jgi:hypothetical protein
LVDEDPNPHVKLPLVDQQWLLNIFLDDETHIFGDVGHPFKNKLISFAVLSVLIWPLFVNIGVHQLVELGEGPEDMDANPTILISGLKHPIVASDEVRLWQSILR